MKNKIISLMGIGIILNWLSLFLSYKKYPNTENIYEPMASGGFPFKTFEYPHPPMGSDWPPAEVWPTFFLNLAIWLMLAALIAVLFRKKIESNKMQKRIILGAIYITLFGLVYIGFKFD
jgi:hypothetical protein